MLELFQNAWPESATPNMAIWFPFCYVSFFRESDYRPVQQSRNTSPSLRIWQPSSSQHQRTHARLSLLHRPLQEPTNMSVDHHNRPHYETSTATLQAQSFCRPAIPRLLQIAELNASAVSIWQLSNESGIAKERFFEALRILLTVVDDELVDNIVNNTFHSDDITRAPHVAPYSTIVGHETCCFSVEVFMAHNQNPPEGQQTGQQQRSSWMLEDIHNSEPVYSSAFLLTNSIPTTGSATASVLFYNIGLVLQLEGLETGRMAQVQLAIEFYQRSLLLIQHPLESASHPSLYPVEIVVLMGAICHNLANCYQTFFQTPDVETMITNMERILQWMDASGFSNTVSNYAFFRTRLFFLKNAVLQCAPSA